MFQSWIVNSEGCIHCVVDCKSYVVPKDHPNYNVLLEALKQGNSDDFVTNYDLHIEEDIEQVNNEVGEGVVIKEDCIYYNGEELFHDVGRTLFNMKSEGFDTSRFIKFVENLVQNPSMRSVEQLWDYITAYGLSITEDGCFLAYKAVTDEYLDKHSRKFDNRPGAVNKMLRNKVDDDPQSACSRGFHVGALGYSGPNGWFYNCNDRVVICKVNPKDVVCVPHDLFHQKIRVCEYTVVGDFQGELNRTCYSGRVNDDYSPKEVNNDKNNYFEKIDVEDMLVDEYYEFDYVNSHGQDTGRRYIIVEEVHDDLVMGQLVEPEDNEGQFRSFHKSGMTNICVFDMDSLEEEYDDYWP